MGVFKGTGTNKKTTLAGILTALVAVGNAGVALLNGEQPDWTVTIAAITTAIGLIFASDSDK